MDEAENFRMNPMRYGFELLTPAMGAKMVEFSTSNKRVYGFAADSKEGLLIYILNKTLSPQKVSIKTEPKVKKKRTTAKGIAMADTPDHWGRLEDISISYDPKIFGFRSTLPPLSYTRFIIK